jgi:hypothetical protein
MTTAVKKTISLPADLARDAEALARAKGKTLSAMSRIVQLPASPAYEGSSWCCLNAPRQPSD